MKDFYSLKKNMYYTLTKNYLLGRTVESEAKMGQILQFPIWSVNLT